MWHRTLDWWRLSHKIYEKTFRREKFSTKQILYFVFLRGVDIARPVWGFAVFGTALKLKMIRVKVQLSKRIHPFFSILEYIQCELQIYYLIREILNWPLSTFSFLSFQCKCKTCDEWWAECIWPTDFWCWRRLLNYCATATTLITFLYYTMELYLH